MKEYTEIDIVCKNCGKSFKLSIGEQKFYDSKGFGYPVRCKECRAAKKASYETKKEEPVKVNPDLIRPMPQEEIDAILKKWRDETIYFADLYNRHHSSTKRGK